MRYTYREEIVCEFCVLLKNPADPIRATVWAFALSISTINIRRTICLTFTCCAGSQTFYAVFRPARIKARLKAKWIHGLLIWISNKQAIPIFAQKEVFFSPGIEHWILRQRKEFRAYTPFHGDIIEFAKRRLLTGVWWEARLPVFDYWLTRLPDGIAVEVYIAVKGVEASWPLRVALASICLALLVAGPALILCGYPIAQLPRVLNLPGEEIEDGRVGLAYPTLCLRAIP